MICTAPDFRTPETHFDRFPHFTELLSLPGRFATFTFRCRIPMANRHQKQERRGLRGLPALAETLCTAAGWPLLSRDGVQALRGAEIGPAGGNQCGNLLLVLNRKSAEISSSSAPGGNQSPPALCRSLQKMEGEIGVLGKMMMLADDQRRPRREGVNRTV